MHLAHTKFTTLHYNTRVVEQYKLWTRKKNCLIFIIKSFYTKIHLQKKISYTNHKNVKKVKKYCIK